MWLLVLSWWPRSARYEHWFRFRHARHLIDSDSDRFYFVDLRLRLWWNRTRAHSWLRLFEQFYRSNNWPALNQAWVAAQLDWQIRCDCNNPQCEPILRHAAHRLRICCVYPSMRARYSKNDTTWFSHLRDRLCWASSTILNGASTQLSVWPWCLFLNQLADVYVARYWQRAHSFPSYAGHDTCRLLWGLNGCACLYSTNLRAKWLRAQNFQGWLHGRDNWSMPLDRNSSLYHPRPTS